MWPTSVVAFASIRLAGIWLFGNGEPDSGSIIVDRPVKLPARIAAVGMNKVYVVGRRSRSPSKPPKKKVLFLMIGPPIMAPNSLRLNGGLVRAKKFRAVNSR